MDSLSADGTERDAISTLGFQKQKRDEGVEGRATSPGPTPQPMNSPSADGT